MFWITKTTMQLMMGEDYEAWSLFGPVHLFWLGLTLLLTIWAWVCFPKFSRNTRRKILVGMTILMVADELWKDIPNLITGQFEWECLPFHLCSVNIFVTILNTWKENKITKTILCCVCIPAAFCALFMPTWTALPMWNFMHLHSETIHVMLFLYPMLIMAEGFRPEKKHFPVLALYLVGLACVDKVINAFLGTNFLFLTHNENNPALVFLQNLTGPFYNLGIVIFLILFCGLLLLGFGALPPTKARD